MSAQQPVSLIPLLCVRCQAPVSAGLEEVAWVCETCGQGLLLGEDGQLIALEVHYAAAIPAGGQGRPFWVAGGQAVLQRQTYKRDESREMQAFWQTPRRFFIPAFELPLQQMLELGSALLRQPPELTPGSPARFIGVRVPPGDVTPLAEFILLSIEAERKDALRSLDFQLTLSQPSLWILP